MVSTMERTWSERKRDKFETDPRRELIMEHRHGLEIIIYWLRKSNEISMTLIGDHQAREFLVPNDRVLDARDHPEYYANQAGSIRQRENYEPGWNDQPWQT